MWTTEFPGLPSTGQTWTVWLRMLWTIRGQPVSWLRICRVSGEIMPCSCTMWKKSSPTMTFCLLPWMTMLTQDSMKTKWCRSNPLWMSIMPVTHQKKSAASRKQWLWMAGFVVPLPHMVIWSIQRTNVSYWLTRKQRLPSSVSLNYRSRATAYIRLQGLYARMES